MRLARTCDRDPGLTRRRRGRGFSYYHADGSLLRDPDERSRITALAVPPAYEDVWICPLAHGHLQATGRDAADSAPKSGPSRSCWRKRGSLRRWPTPPLARSTKRPTETRGSSPTSCARCAAKPR